MSFNLTKKRSELLLDTLRGKSHRSADLKRGRVEETQGVDIGEVSYLPNIDYGFGQPGVVVPSRQNELRDYDTEQYVSAGGDYVSVAPAPGDVAIENRRRGLRSHQPRRFVEHMRVTDGKEPLSAYYFDERLAPVLAPQLRTPELDNFVDGNNRYSDEMAQAVEPAFFGEARQLEQNEEMLIGAANPALDVAVDQAKELQGVAPRPRPQPAPQPGPALDPESGKPLPQELVSDDPTPQERGWFDDMGRYRGEGYSFGQRPLMGYGRAIAENMGADANVANWAERGGAGLLAVGVGLPALLAAADALQDDPVQPIVISNRS